MSIIDIICANNIILRLMRNTIIVYNIVYAYILMKQKNLLLTTGELDTIIIYT